MLSGSAGIMAQRVEQMAWEKRQNAAQQTLKELSFSPLYICCAAFLPVQPASGCLGKSRTRFREFQLSAGDLRPRNTPLLSSARRSEKELDNWLAACKLPLTATRARASFSSHLLPDLAPNEPLILIILTPCHAPKGKTRSVPSRKGCLEREAKPLLMIGLLSPDG